MSKQSPHLYQDLIDKANAGNHEAAAELAWRGFNKEGKMVGSVEANKELPIVYKPCGVVGYKLVKQD